MTLGPGTPPEAPRDQAASDFTPILRRLLYASPGVLAVVFVDWEGECVDYCSALPPFDAKVAGAHMQIVMSDIASRAARVGGITRMLHLVGDDRELVVRRVSEEYVLTVVVSEGGVVRRVLEAIDRAVLEIRDEAGLSTPPWDPVDPGLHVELRSAVGWPYAPATFSERGKTVVVQHVIGRWVEGAASTGGDLVCFRVRTDSGEELTLAHDPVSDRWIRR